MESLALTNEHYLTLSPEPGVCTSALTPSSCCPEAVGRLAVSPTRAGVRASAP